MENTTIDFKTPQWQKLLSPTKAQEERRTMSIDEAKCQSTLSSISTRPESQSNSPSENFDWVSSLFNCCLTSESTEIESSVFSDIDQISSTEATLNSLDLEFPAEGDQGTVETNVKKSLDVSPHSNEEARKVLEHWLADDEDEDLEMTEFTKKTNLLSCDRLSRNLSCVSPTESVKKFDGANIDVDETESLSSDADESHDTTTSALSFEEIYESALQKLTESMKRSEQTRRTLKNMTTSK